MKWLTFNGQDCSGTGIHGSTCDMYNNFGVDEVVREDTGIYKIYWNQAFDDYNYVLLCDSNVWQTGGSVCIIGGNNDATSSYYGISTMFASVQTRVMNTNSQKNSDYIAVLAF